MAYGWCFCTLKKVRRTRGSSGGTYAERGNEFHYRWVAQRLLKLLRPASRLESVTVEGDIAPKDGDESLDAVEYYSDGRKRHIQLKHSTTKRDVAANLSDYPKTIKDFAKIFSNEERANKAIFSIITNRQWSASANKKLESLGAGETSEDKLWMDVAKVLKTEQGSVLFRDFCSRLELIGGEPDLQEQMSGIKRTLSEHLPTLADTNRANQIVQIVRDRAIAVGKEREPIRTQDILAALEVFCEEDVFPAPQRYDEGNDYVDNQGLKELRSAIDESKDH